MRIYTLKATAPRLAFTLIELIVVIGIVLLLATMTLLALNSFDSERVRSGARQLQSMLEGARNRAILAGQARGVRFLVENDPLNGRKCSSMIYIGASDTWSKGTITLMRTDFDFDGVVDFTDRDHNMTTEQDPDVYMIVDALEQQTGTGASGATGSTGWYNLLQRGYLPIYEDGNDNGVLDPGEDLNGNNQLDRETARIKIPGDRNGTWYNVSTYYLSKNLYSPNPEVRKHPNVLELIPLRPYRDPGTTPTTEVVAFEGTGPNSYILELPARVLPDVEPALLPGDVVIDLDASKVPDSWRSLPPPPSPPNPYIDPLQMPYSNQMDILFSPRGTVIGPEAATGLIHFYLCMRKDVDTINDGGVTSQGVPFAKRSVVSQATTWNAGAVIRGENGNSTDLPVGERALVTLFTHTGKIGSYPLKGDDGPPNGLPAPSDRFADDPFFYATRGEGGLAQ